MALHGYTLAVLWILGQLAVPALSWSSPDWKTSMIFYETFYNSMRKAWCHWVLFRSEGTYKVALLCTLSSLFLSFWRYGAQDSIAYFKFGWTSDLLSCIMLDSFLKVEVLFIRPNTQFVYCSCTLFRWIHILTNDDSKIFFFRYSL